MTCDMTWLTTRSMKADGWKYKWMFKLISEDINHCKSECQTGHNPASFRLSSLQLYTQTHPQFTSFSESQVDTFNRFVISLVYMSHNRAAFSFDKHPNIHKKQWMLFKERLSQGVVEPSELLGNWEPIIFFHFLSSLSQGGLVWS